RSERGRFVADRCSGDAPLREAVETLLRIHEEKRGGGRRDAAADDPTASVVSLPSRPANTMAAGPPRPQAPSAAGPSHEPARIPLEPPWWRSWRIGAAL